MYKCQGKLYTSYRLKKREKERNAIDINDTGGIFRQIKLDMKISASRM